MRCGAPTAHGSLMGNDEIRSRRRERRLTKVSLVRETPPCCNDNEQCPRDKADINADKRVHVDWSDRGEVPAISCILWLRLRSISCLLTTLGAYYLLPM